MKRYLSIGLMSGTSMDGIDCGLIKTDGDHDITVLGKPYSLQYDPTFKTLLKAAAFAVKQKEGNLIEAKAYYLNAITDYLKESLDDKTNTKTEEKIAQEIAEEFQKIKYYLEENNIEFAKLTFDTVAQHSTYLHGKIVANLIKELGLQPSDIDLIGYHGQTLFHNPAAKITIQVGDGAALYKQTGIPVVNDFRTNDVQHGGQGAPLAPLYHQALAVRDNLWPVAIVNCGGIANITLITGKQPTEVIGFDTGPGNGLVDRFVLFKTNGKEQMDKDGQYGSKGKINDAILKKLLTQAVIKNGKDYLSLPFPKSLDINDLQLIPEIKALSLEDGCATLEAFTAQTIVNSLDLCSLDSSKIPHHWILAGGGWNNPVIIAQLKMRLETTFNSSFTVQNADKIPGWSSQGMEPQIFAHFAVRSVKKLPLTVPNTTGVDSPWVGGVFHGNKDNLLKWENKQR